MNERKEIVKKIVADAVDAYCTLTDENPTDDLIKLALDITRERRDDIAMAFRDIARYPHDPEAVIAIQLAMSLRIASEMLDRRGKSRTAEAKP